LIEAFLADAVPVTLKENIREEILDRIRAWLGAAS